MICSSPSNAQATIQDHSQSINTCRPYLCGKSKLKAHITDHKPLIRPLQQIVRTALGVLPLKRPRLVIKNTGVLKGEGEKISENL